jgi:integrase
MSVMRRYLTEAEQAALLKAAKGSSDPLAQRDWHWMSALLLTGMRIGEFASLSVPQVELALKTGWLVTRADQCKGGTKGHEFLVSEQLRLHLVALLRWARGCERAFDAGFTPLVPGRDGYPMTPRAFQMRVKVWAAEAGLDGRVSPHWFRHSRGMNIIRRTRATDPARALLVAKEALGHASLKSTGVYLRLSREELASELAAVDAVGGRLSKQQARRAAMAGGV